MLGNQGMHTCAHVHVCTHTLINLLLLLHFLLLLDITVTWNDTSLLWHTCEKSQSCIQINTAVTKILIMPVVPWPFLIYHNSDISLNCQITGRPETEKSTHFWNSR